MICVSLGNRNFQKMAEAARSLEFAEVRIDLCRLTIDQVARIFSSGNTLVATCRPGFFSDAERGLLLQEAIHSGARYVDIEIDSPTSLREEILKTAGEEGCLAIISYHNDDCTPGTVALKDIVRQCFAKGADLCKVACRCRTVRDMLTVLSLYGEDGDSQGKMIALGMGENASWTRMAAPFLGAPFTYAALEDSERTAEGQLSFQKMRTLFSIMKKEQEER
ncbi:MAG: type I 3-dehydroquinate dehydratase [Candidatus Aminicenantes bacterium]|nr:type I 3-dehydroquinate dehydratase [Candidatus Aminicenantes bacterium]